jgi:beta-ureidopropionase
MPRKVRVVTTSGFPAEAAPEDNRARAIRCIEAAGQQGADLLCLPEAFLGHQAKGAVEPLPGPTFDALAEQARKHGLWVVAGLYARAAAGAGGVDNCAVVISRQGDLAGCYVKVHPTTWECDDGVVPGEGPVVIDADFGRLGLAICYDIGWPSHWADLARLDAELVVWPSAYDGGSPLSYYAWAHRYHVVSAVRTAYAKVIDLAGYVAASTTLWHPLASATIDLEQELFHADFNEEQLPKVEAEMGPRVTVRCFDEERYFTLESNDSDWPMARVKAHYGLESFRDYHARAAQVQDQHRPKAARPAAETGGQPRQQ